MLNTCLLLRRDSCVINASVCVCVFHIVCCCSHRAYLHTHTQTVHTDIYYSIYGIYHLYLLSVNKRATTTFICQRKFAHTVYIIRFLSLSLFLFIHVEWEWDWEGESECYCIAVDAMIITVSPRANW